MANLNKMLQILEKEYEINGVRELKEAVWKTERLDVSIFAKPLTERSNKHGRKNELRSDQKNKRKLSQAAAGA